MRIGIDLRRLALADQLSMFGAAPVRVKAHARRTLHGTGLVRAHVRHVEHAAPEQPELPLERMEREAAVKDYPLIRIGLPYSSAGELTQQAQRLGASTLLSMGSYVRPPAGGVTGFPTFAGFSPLGAAPFSTPAALDSGGFTAMLAGGYRWTVDQHVDFVATNRGAGEQPFPWAWWAAMDYCVEPEIAGNRAEVERRMQQTVDTYGETLDHLVDWWNEGVTDVPAPMPTLQGRTAADYVWSARAMAKEIDAHHPCSCPTTGPETCTAECHRDHAGLPSLVGLGSVCRRELHGPSGLLTILDALDRELPPHVRLHLFGVKGATLAHLDRFGTRVASVDSMAWDKRATEAVKEQRRAAGVAHLRPGDEGFIPNTTENRARHMREWYETQQRRKEE